MALIHIGLMFVMALNKVGVLSPVLFCVYALRSAGVGCHMDHMFVGALPFAEDIVLAHGAWRTLYAETCR